MKKDFMAGSSWSAHGGLRGEGRCVVVRAPEVACRVAVVLRRTAGAGSGSPGRTGCSPPTGPARRCMAGTWSTPCWTPGRTGPAGTTRRAPLGTWRTALPGRCRRPSEAQPWRSPGRSGRQAARAGSVLRSSPGCRRCRRCCPAARRARLAGRAPVGLLVRARPSRRGTAGTGWSSAGPRSCLADTRCTPMRPAPRPRRSLRARVALVGVAERGVVSSGAGLAGCPVSR
jgi:hypothetical protein